MYNPVSDVALGACAGAEVAALPVGDDHVRAVLFDMDGVLCESEEQSREAAVALFAEMGVAVKTTDFVPFMGTGMFISQCPPLARPVSSSLLGSVVMFEEGHHSMVM